MEVWAFGRNNRILYIEKGGELRSRKS